MSSDATNGAVHERIQGVFRQVLARSDLTVQSTDTPADVPGWDSFNHVNLVLALEEEFGLTFSTAEIGKLASVGDFCCLIEGKLER